jgi:hypothetical protein
MTTSDPAPAAPAALPPDISVSLHGKTYFRKSGRWYFAMSTAVAMPPAGDANARPNPPPTVTAFMPIGGSAVAVLDKVAADQLNPPPAAAPEPESTVPASVRLQQQLQPRLGLLRPATP